MASLYVSDVMDIVACTIEVEGWSEQYGPPDTVYRTTVTWPGVGETEPVRWLLRALQKTLEDLSRPPTRRVVGGLPSGSSYTISESGDMAI